MNKHRKALLLQSRKIKYRMKLLSKYISVEVVSYLVHHLHSQSCSIQFGTILRFTQNFPRIRALLMRFQEVCIVFATTRTLTHEPNRISVKLFAISAKSNTLSMDGINARHVYTLALWSVR